ncbi:sporulation protein YqfD [Alicyclobacillus dauci]|uniref:Sporulation protein YqfD n=1 Tax=Alicyclobacillus dauci TaxID=1475485 RepID=A0ABY6Z8Q8_9BACL|nr:sporulation protein YqfD [Alicyclobacillus dauci]WAH38546.1 sporulation protein YqfD [Alicyclobacillus dauci]
MKYSAVQYKLYGELTLVLRGRNVGQCLGLLQQNGIPLRFVRVRNGVGYCNICLRDFDAVYRTCRAHHVRFRIEGRHGLPFWRQRLWRRKSLAVGAIAFLCVVYGMSSVIWRIDVTGPKDDEGVNEIREAAKSIGLYVGQRKSQLADPVKLQQFLLKKAPDFVWIGVRTTGSVTTIQAIPKVEGTKPLDQTPHNIVATQPAVIRSVSAARGRVLVKANQYVRPGQVLVTGNLADGQPSVPADAKVMGEVWYTSKVAVPLKVVQKGLTGETVQRDYIAIGSLRLRVWGWQEPHFPASYERDKITDWKIGNITSPIQWENVRLYEATQSAENYSMEQAKSSALDLAASDVRSQMRGEGRILGQSVLHEQVTHGTLYETVLTRVEQDIGVAAPIPAPQPKQENDTNSPH